MHALRRVLFMVLPAKASLAQLTFVHSHLAPSQLQGLTSQLAQLTSLTFSCCTFPDDGPVEAVLEALLAQAPRLQRLRLLRCCKGSVPAALVSRRGLTSLYLQENDLDTLPAGAYLEGKPTAVSCQLPVAGWLLVPAAWL